MTMRDFRVEISYRLSPSGEIRSWKRRCDGRQIDLQLSVKASNFFHNIHQEDILAVQEVFTALQASPEELFEALYRRVDQSGSFRWLDAKVFAVFDHVERCIQEIHAVEKDITDDILVLDSLYRERDKLFSLVESTSGDVIYRLDKSMKFSFVSFAARHVWGYSPLELIGKPAWFGASDADAQRFESILTQLISNKEQPKPFIINRLGRHGNVVREEVQLTPQWDAASNTVESVNAISRRLSPKCTSKQVVAAGDSEALFHESRLLLPPPSNTSATDGRKRGAASMAPPSSAFLPPFGDAPSKRLATDEVSHATLFSDAPFSGANDPLLSLMRAATAALEARGADSSVPGSQPSVTTDRQVPIAPPDMPPPVVHPGTSPPLLEPSSRFNSAHGPASAAAVGVLSGMHRQGSPNLQAPQVPLPAASEGAQFGRLFHPSPHQPPQMTQQMFSWKGVAQPARRPPGNVGPSAGADSKAGNNGSSMTSGEQRAPTPAESAPVRANPVLPATRPIASRLFLPSEMQPSIASATGARPAKQPRRLKESPAKVACRNCGTVKSLEWRKGSDGQKSLCNPCGLRYARSLKQAANKEAKETR